MSLIDQLIERLASQGVQQVSIGEVTFEGRERNVAREFSEVRSVTNSQGLVRTSDFFDNARTSADTKNYKVVRPGMYAYNPSRINVGSIAWLDEDAPVIVSPMYVVFGLGQARILPEYLALFLDSASGKRKVESKTEVGARFRLTYESLSSVRLALPSLDVQREIVRVLDLFKRLESELKAELEARMVQHAHYWSALLSPSDGWRQTTLGEIAEIFDGPHATPRKTATGPWYLSISSLRGGRFDLRESAHLGVEDYATWTRRVTPTVGDTMFSYETRLGQAAYWDCDEPAALGRRMGLLRPRKSVVDPRFLTLLYLGPEFQAQVRKKTIHGSTVDRIPIADMAAWEVSIPPRSEQARIVAILDEFDALVNDPSVGLPAELSARRRQYEYYLDRLMTLEEAVA